jgi:hypothetical protein
MTFYVKSHPHMLIPHSTGLISCSPRKVALESRLLIIHTFVQVSYTGPCYCKGARRIPALELYTTTLNVSSAPAIPSTAGSIMYCPARSATCAVTAPERASVNGPDEASGGLPISANSPTRTNAGA